MSLTGVSKPIFLSLSSSPFSTARRVSPISLTSTFLIRNMLFKTFAILSYLTAPILTIDILWHPSANCQGQYALGCLDYIHFQCCSVGWNANPGSFRFNGDLANILNIWAFTRAGCPDKDPPDGSFKGDGRREICFITPKYRSAYYDYGGPGRPAGVGKRGPCGRPNALVKADGTKFDLSGLDENQYNEVAIS
ncbi:uncharacterized protein B0I36DRAFT_361238 [Microdochium trichocladiopsis]|uniref:Uncharacterized protein n=1 Tax=Microdochium trichocladiopsis TaxID=1682393 RepID=A0A9P9BTX5_9PEZI|nr:uncharacterized protein B0I36DRAFT_361238 [Microdochium trichocladiopsis]KAH7035927.1 hypothetical protein B0I36DRAFT_361238 [Microdochium trichocladiopsis]